MVFQVYSSKSSATIAAMSLKTGTSPIKLLGTIQTLLVVLSIATAATILGTAANLYRTYTTQQAAFNPWWLPLWGAHFDTKGVKANIGTAAGIVLLNLVFLIMMVVAKVSFQGHGQSITN
jgi:hypothetical protein